MHPLKMRRLGVALASTLLLAASSAAQAGLFRAYLSKNGSDSANCTLLQPCRLLPAALAAVDEGGEIWMLDSANYNTAPVDVAKSVTILTVPGALGSLIGNAGNAITVSTPQVELTLRNVAIVHLAGAGHGVAVTGNAARVTVENSEIYGFLAGGGDGIRVEAEATLTVAGSTFRNNVNGILLRQGVASVSRTYLLNNDEEGLVVEPSGTGFATAYVSDSVASGNLYGISAFGDSETNIGRLFITRTVSSNNLSSGFDVWGGFGEITLGDCAAIGNEDGIVDWGGTIFSLGNNVAVGNSTDDVYLPMTPLAPR